MESIVFDIGNTLIKAGIFKNDELVRVEKLDVLNKESLASLLKEEDVKQAIFSSVRVENFSELLNSFLPTITLDERTKLPFKNLYKTPATLGRDRIASVAGAISQYPKEDILVIDAGTCIKYDLITAKGEYPGGGISPGIEMRFKALNTFTGKLPLINFNQQQVELIGSSTEGSILSGVLNGALAEVDGIITQYKKHYPSIKVLLTGGDSDFFAKGLKSTIFADPYLTLKGLNFILKYNVEKQPG